MHGLFSCRRSNYGDGHDTKWCSIVRVGDPAAIRSLFNSVATHYDCLNDVLSLGQHRIWKSELLARLNPQPGERWLDLCCGTGDLTLALARRLRPGGSVIGIDSASRPLGIARRRAAREPWLPVNWHLDNALGTTQSSAAFDGVVMSYGLRNLQNVSAGLAEMARLLPIGGRAGVLDFNRLLPNSLSGWFQHFYLCQLVVPIATLLGLEQEYAYIEDSLKSFPAAPKLENLALRAGFTCARHQFLAADQMRILLLER